MAIEVHNRTEQSPAALLSGIVTDIQDLIKQQFHLTRKEVEADLSKTCTAASTLALGGVFAIAGAGAFVLTLAHLLHWMTSPPGSDPASIPLWGCYGVVGALFVVIGGALIYAGQRQFASFNPLPDESAQALKENVEWITSKK